MTRRCVSFVVPDIGAPSVGAAVRLAEALADDFDVEIVGPDLGRGVISMYRDDTSFRAVRCPRLYRMPDFLWERRRIDRAVTGDVVIAVKAFRNTVPVALRARAQRGAKAVVFLDEWDGAVLSGLSRPRRIARRIAQWHHPLDDAHYDAVEGLIPRADMVLSTTSFLRRKFGGRVIAMGVDTERFRPQPAEAVASLRRSLGLEGKRLIVFGGVVRPHKGVEIIPEALRMIGDASIRLLVVGPVTPHLAAMRKDPAYGPWIEVAGAPLEDPDGVNAAIHKQMPLYLDLADLVVLPLLDTPLAQSQMPIKVFEALAMAKPVIGSDVADLPEVLAGCGRIVPSGNVRDLAAAIQEVFADPAEAARRGAAARARCIERYSRDVTRRLLVEIVDALR